MPVLLINNKMEVNVLDDIMLIIETLNKLMQHFKYAHQITHLASSLFFALN